MTDASISKDHSVFLSLLPGLETHARFKFRGLPAADREEAVADTVAYAFDSFRRLRQRGKDPTAFPVTFSRVVTRAVANGRAVGRACSTRDVLARPAQRRHGFVVQSLDVPRPAGSEWWRDIVVDRRASVPDQAVVNVDFPAWLATLPDAKRRTVRLLAEGNSTGETAAIVGVTPGRISQLRTELGASWRRLHAGVELASLTGPSPRGRTVARQGEEVECSAPW